MATIKATTPITPTKISQFLGLNLSDTGDTQIKLGESGNMNNFYITDDYKLRKMYGYKMFHNFNTPINGIHACKIGNTGYILVSTDGKLYSFLQDEVEDDSETDNVNLLPELEIIHVPNGITAKINPDSSITVNGTWDGTGGHLPPLGEPGDPLVDEIVVAAKSQITYTANTNYTSWIKATNTPADFAAVLNSSRKKTGYAEIDENNTTDTTTFSFDENTPSGTGSSYWTPFQANSPYIYIAAGDINSQITFNNFNVKAMIVQGSYDVGTMPAYRSPSDRLNPTLIGNIKNNKTSFFEFDNKIYILCGGYYKWDGTTLSEVEGYIPKIFINGNPATGSGQLYDELNMLTGKKHMTYNGDGVETVYQLPKSQIPITSVDKVIVDGVEKVKDTDYTVNLADGKVSFIQTAPSDAMDNVDIYWTKDDGDRSIIEGMKYGTVFGGDVDTRVFLYGNPNCQNRIYYSGISYPQDIAIPSVEYFPATAQIDIGASNFAVMDLTRQYDRLLVTTNRPDAYYLTTGTETLNITLSSSETTSKLVPSISTYPLNDVHGCVALGQGQLIKNYPITVDENGLTLWKATNVRDEKNAEPISERINIDLNSLPLANVKTIDFQFENQMWFGVNNLIYIYNYENSTFSRIIIPDTLTHFTEIGGHVYMALSDGRIVKWSKDYQTFDNAPIKALWEMNFSNYDTANYRKTMRKMWVLMQPQGKSSVEVSYISNKVSEPMTKYISYDVVGDWFGEMDFRTVTFKTSVNPQPFRLKLKAKKFTNMKIVLRNDEETNCTILQLIMNVQAFGESK